MHVHAFRRDELMEFAVVTLQMAPKDTCYLELTETPDAAVRQRREPGWAAIIDLYETSWHENAELVVPAKAGIQDAE